MPRLKNVKYKAVNQKDIDSVQTLFNTKRFSTTGISKVLGRAWGTIHHIIESGFDLDGYKRLTREYKLERDRQKKLTFKPYNGTTTPGPMKVQEIPVKPENDMSKAKNMDDVLNIMWNQQQADAKVLVDKATKDEAIHKIRNGLQMISEGLGELLGKGQFYFI